MRIPRTLIGAAMITAMATGQAAHAGPQATTAPARDAANGKKLFLKVGCSECHGNEGQGSPLSGPRIAPDPLPLAAFMRYVRAPRLQMPPYTAKVLPDEQLADIYEFARTRPRGGEIDSILPPLK